MDRVLSRRSWLGRTAALNLGALNLGALWNAQAFANPDTKTPLPAKIKACIFVFYYGGPSHLDTFDMKPEAPAEVRGEFKTISTSVPGLKICEHLPNMAKVMHKCAIIRTMSHANRLHDSASTESLTGRPPRGGDKENFQPVPEYFPCFGSIVSYMRRRMGFEIPHAALPFVFHNVVDVPCQGGGFLGKSWDPLRIVGDSKELAFRVADFQQRPDLGMDRMERRRQLKESLEVASLAQRPEGTQLKSFYDNALRLMQSQALKTALRIETEDAKTRARYGEKPAKTSATGIRSSQALGLHLRGQNLLMARRLVESGIPFVNVYDFKQQGQNWDSHNKNFVEHKEVLLPQADQALAALINDLDERGLLESTLVVATGEFGRTPKINANAGRDHWPDCYSVVLAGGGIQGGALFGESDRIGAYPAADPVTPADLAATIYWRFGLNPESEIHDLSNRPYRLTEGRPIQSIFA